MFYYYREQAALKARQYQRALDDIAKAIELNPKDLTYKAEQAVVNLRVGRYEEAVQILNNILKEDPKYAEAYRLLGLCQIQLKKTDEACGNFNKAKEGLPKDGGSRISVRRSADYVSCRTVLAPSEWSDSRPGMEKDICSKEHTSKT